MIIEIKLYGNISIRENDREKIFVKRKFSWNSNIKLDFFRNDILFLKTSYFTLIPFSKLKIIFQDMEEKVSIEKLDGEEFLIVDNNRLQILHNNFYSDKLCTILNNGQQICEVVNHKKFSTEGWKLELNFDITNENVKFYSAIFVVLNYLDIDGGE